MGCDVLISMKIKILKRISFGLLSVSVVFLSGCLQNYLGNNDNNDPFGAATEVGVPDGTAVTGTIGPSGGSITGENGKIELIIPAGALNTTTEITIQPITNTMPLYIGKAWRLTPDNLEFNIPVSLVYHFSDPELTGTVPEAIFVAHQDEEQVWQAQSGTVTDTVNNRITASLHHFSDWSFFPIFIMTASSEIVEPEEEIEISILLVPGAGSFGSLGPEETDPVGYADQYTGSPDFRIDLAAPFPVSKGSIQGKESPAVYTAPSGFPDDNTMNIVKIVGNIRLSPNKEYHLTTEISLGPTISLTIDGISYYIKQSGLVLSSLADGSTGLTGSSQSQMVSISLSWPGIGVGTYQSGGIDNNHDFGIETSQGHYMSYYYIPCSNNNEIAYQTAAVNVTRTDNERSVCWGSFSGTANIMEGRKKCNDGSETDNYREVEFIGYFRTNFTLF